LRAARLATSERCRGHRGLARARPSRWAGHELHFSTGVHNWLGLFNDYTNGYFSLLGIGMGPQAGVAFTGGAASPRNFASGEVIDASATFTSGFYEP
jgi:hypothetical protein